MQLPFGSGGYPISRLERRRTGRCCCSCCQSAWMSPGRHSFPEQPPASVLPTSHSHPLQSLGNAADSLGMASPVLMSQTCKQQLPHFPVVQFTFMWQRRVLTRTSCRSCLEHYPIRPPRKVEDLTQLRPTSWMGIVRSQASSDNQACYKPPALD